VSGRTADVLIIGGGAYGLSAAWWMARRRDGARVLVLDAADFAAGGTGRIGGGFRMTWGLDFNILLSRESIAFFEEAHERLDYPAGIDLKQCGYLLLAHDEAALAGFRRNHQTHRRYDVPSEILTPEDCLALSPGLNPDGLVGGCFCGKDGTASPFLWLDALLRAARREGAEVRYGTRVHGMTPEGEGFVVETSMGRVTSSKILICTDWQAPELLRPLGLDVPITGMPKEAFVTEAWRETIGPCLVSFKHDMFVNQMARGSIVAVPTRIRPDGDDISSTPSFASYGARTFLDLLPGLEGVNLLRTWCGVISKTPDMQAVLGETDIPNLYLAVSAYKGFMTSPAVGRLMAELILDGASDRPATAAGKPRVVIARRAT
jgi:sarcosine oxidase subunit beta